MSCVTGCQMTQDWRRSQNCIGKKIKVDLPRQMAVEFKAESQQQEEKAKVTQVFSQLMDNKWITNTQLYPWIKIMTWSVSISKPAKNASDTKR